MNCGFGFDEFVHSNGYLILSILHNLTLEIGGGRGYFSYNPPGRKFFENTPPCKIKNHSII